MDGFEHHKAYLNLRQQKALLAQIVKIIQTAPLYTPTMPKSGRPFSVLETNCGPLGWVSDKDGYRYQSHHPQTGVPWPAMPASFIKIWRQLSSYEDDPQAGLINYYNETAKMGLHQDKDEQNFAAPVISVSLGHSAKFRLGGLKRRDKTRAIEVHSGDVIVMSGKARLRYHGIDRIFKNSSNLLSEHTDLPPGRINITLRRVT